jgi:EAL domain-containing protein (putative c-di-GMP-specific phosphodiesterase class I)
MSLTRAINKDAARSALAGALIAFAREIESRIVAEGIETAGELATLRRLGADAGQGYFLQRPQPLPALMQFLIARKLGSISEEGEPGAMCGLAANLPAAAKRQSR